MFISETELVVRYAETDQMGVVHHSNYPVWFEAGRTDYIKKMGIPYSKIEEKGIMLPLIELKCYFKSYAQYEDIIIIKTKIKEYTGVRFIFQYEAVKRESGITAAEGETAHVWTNKDLKPINIKKVNPDIHQIIMKAMNSGL